MILNNGSDGPVISQWSLGGRAAIARGCNAITFDGPGEGASLHRQHLYFRADWEKVVTPVVDWLVARPEVDTDKIALQGISQGGYWAPRAAAFEHRLSALVADPGVMRVASSWEQHLPEGTAAADRRRQPEGLRCAHGRQPERAAESDACVAHGALRDDVVLRGLRQSPRADARCCDRRADPVPDPRARPGR